MASYLQVRSFDFFRLFFTWSRLKIAKKMVQQKGELIFFPVSGVSLWSLKPRVPLFYLHFDQKFEKSAERSSQKQGIMMRKNS